MRLGFKEVFWGILGPFSMILELIGVVSHYFRTSENWASLLTKGLVRDMLVKNEFTKIILTYIFLNSNSNMFYKLFFKYAFKWALFLFISMFMESVKACYLEKYSKAWV